MNVSFCSVLPPANWSDELPNKGNSLLTYLNQSLLNYSHHSLKAKAFACKAHLATKSYAALVVVCMLQKNEKMPMNL